MAHKFRNSFTHVMGNDPANMVQGRVIRVNLVKWTVDVVAQYDRKRYFQIQVGSPYQNPTNGEGFYVFPEVGSTCQVCIPSDSSPPFISAFVMPSQTIDDSSSDAPSGTSSHGQQPAHPTDSTFAGNRMRAKPGDIVMRTRDGNFVVLHRGGVLQIGSTELAQRIYIPLRNLITDISENYEHHNTNGSIVWGLQEGPSLQHFPSQYMQTFRVFADDKYADIKVAVGKVYNPVPEPDGGTTLAEAEVASGDDGQGSNPIIYEVTVSPKGFVAQSGESSGPATVTDSVLKFTFDRQGNTLLRTEGNLLIQVKKALTFKASKAVLLQTDDAATVTAKSGISVDGGTFSHIKGDLVRMGQGQIPVARVGDITSMSLIATPIQITLAGAPTPGTPQPATLTTLAPMVGSIASGNNQVLA